MLNALTDVFITRLFIYLLFAFVLVYGLYYRRQRKRDFVFSYLMFGLMVFVLTFFLKDIDISLGFTFGLFAVFAMLQYRTEPISPKEMTYLLIVIGAAMLNAVSQLSYLELSLINTFILLMTGIIQSRLFLAEEDKQTVQYERIELIKPNRRQELIKDLENRTGLVIHRVEVRNIDFLRDTATLRIYHEPGSKNE